KVRSIFNEMVSWCKDEGVDYINGETYYYHEEALIALEEIKKYDLPAVITLGLMGENILRDGYTVEESCKILEENGALVVGMNCFRGPDTMQPYLEKIRKNTTGYVGALPLPYRTTEENPTFFNLPDGGCSCHLPTDTTFPTALDPLYHNRYELAEWATEAHDSGINYIGLCCSASDREKIRKNTTGYVGALPLPYRTTEENPTFFNLPDGGCSCHLPTDTTFPTALDPLYHNRYELAEWAKEAHDSGINYIGLCCGA